MQNLSTSLITLIAMAVFGAAGSPAQSMDDLNLQVHGYATQGLVYTTNNSWDTTDSTGGSAAWTEAVVNLSMQPEPKLRIGIQARYYILGDYGDQIVLDWAQVDYKVNEHIGFRAGDVKTPLGLLNETQDIDPAHLWVLLPQAIYPLASRNSLLDHYGGVVYGSIPLNESLGKLEYRAFGGQRTVGRTDPSFDAMHSRGIDLPNGLIGKIFGGTLRWNPPLPGLIFGVSETSGATNAEVTEGSLQGTMNVPRFRQLLFREVRAKQVDDRGGIQPPTDAGGASIRGCADDRSARRHAPVLRDGQLQVDRQADGRAVLQQLYRSQSGLHQLPLPEGLGRSGAL